MPGTPHQTLKILTLLSILRLRSDEQHPLPMEEILLEMEAVNLPVERKAVYKYIRALVDCGYDVRNRKREGWFIGAREFTLPEIKLLVDAVQSSHFITQENTDILISKLEHLCSVYQGAQLQRQVYLSGRPKVTNSRIYENVDQIYTAIGCGKAISFLYFDYDLRHRKVYRHDRKVYNVSPFGLIWSSERYYLAGFDHETEDLRSYRVDKMDTVKILTETRRGLDIYPDFSIAEYEQRRFGMFSGEETTVVLQGKMNMVNIVWDRFGDKVMMVPDGPDHFRFSITVDLSPQFFGWLFGLNGDMVILGPQKALDVYHQLLEKTIQHENTRPPATRLPSWRPPQDDPKGDVS